MARFSASINTFFMADYFREREREDAQPTIENPHIIV